MKCVVVGSGGREAALAAKLSYEQNEVVVTPGGPGIPGSVATPATELSADLFIIGPEVPLVAGLADQLRAQGKLVFGPGAAGAMIEGSKAWMKEVLVAAGVPTAHHHVIADAHEDWPDVSLPCAVKTDYLAAGKGVSVVTSYAAAMADIRAKFAANPDGKLVIEDCLFGEEISIMYLCDGTRVVPLPVARDYKRLGDGDTGPNTGGMGAVCSVWINCLPEINRMVRATLAELRRRGIDYRGVLYAGVMLTADGPKILEFNARFGDPETQVIVPLIDNLTDLLFQAAEGDLHSEPRLRPGTAVCITLAAPGYPDNPVKGGLIGGLTEAEALGVQVLHAGTSRTPDGQWQISGGRALYVVAEAAKVELARQLAYAAVDCITGDLIYRTDIAL